MYRAFVITFLISLCLMFAGCSPRAAQLQQKINTVQASNLQMENFALRLLESLKTTSANNILRMTAHPGKPIVLDVAVFEINQPIDLVAVFNSTLFQRDWADVFPKTTNGWDAFIQFLGTVEAVIGSPVPWLANSINQAVKNGGLQFTGDGNSVALDGSRIDNSDNSDRSNNSDNSDNSRRGVESDDTSGSF